jgi:hypothetical protein
MWFSVWSCGWLPIPFAIKDKSDYRAGRVVTVTGCRTGLVSTGQVNGGPTEYTCVQNQTDHQPFWDPYDNIRHTLCTEAVEEADLALIIGVAVAVVAFLVIAIVIALIFWRRKSAKKQYVPVLVNGFTV